MALSAGAWASALYAQFQAKGFKGPKLMDFCQAVADGSVQHVVGKSFATVDNGTVAGSGQGTGNGIISIPQASVTSTILSTATSLFGQAGPSLPDCAEVIAKVLVEQMKTATLVSTHSPVCIGSGVVTPGSIPVDGDAWASAIEAAAPFNGEQWPNFCKAIGQGCASGFSQATGQVTILGSPQGQPSPGAGAGSGVIS